ncbi:hypothetical protein HOK021_43700 [Streptomyces hygroscopicus]|nr:hypothetical protein HOK021_43700 [Streptomyces hygroscopicus]
MFAGVRARLLLHPSEASSAGRGCITRSRPCLLPRQPAIGSSPGLDSVVRPDVHRRVQVNGGETGGNAPVMGGGYGESGRSRERSFDLAL